MVKEIKSMIILTSDMEKLVSFITYLSLDIAICL